MNKESIEDLNALLKGELAAVESYLKAMDTFEAQQEPFVENVLRDCKVSHELRVLKLQNAINELGGHPEQDPGPWGGLVKLAVGGAGALGDKAVIAALEEGEDMGLNEYEWRLLRMHGEHRNLVKDELLPEQELTHKKMSKLVRAATSGVWPPTPDAREI